MKRLQKWGLVLGAVLAFGADCQGQIRINVVPANQVQTLTLTGTVFDASGAPAPGVTVVMAPLTSPSRLPVITDSEGNYSLQWRPRPANVNVNVQIPPMTYMVMARDPAHNLAAAHAVDESTTNLDLHLQPGLTISFKVEDPAGNPITNAEARFTVILGRSGSAITNQLTPTNGDRSRIEFNALPQGYRFSGSVRASGYGMNSLPVVPDMETQTNFLELQAVVFKPANLKLAGRVVDADGKPVAGARVFISGVGQPTTNTLTDEAGRFLLGACEGAVNVTATLSGIGQPASNGRMQTTGGDTNVQIKLAPPNQPINPPLRQAIPQPRQPDLLPLG